MKCWMVIQYSGQGATDVSECTIDPIVLRHQVLHADGGFIAIPAAKGTELLVNLAKVDALAVFDHDPRLSP